jgi:hypothetical protein
VADGLEPQPSVKPAALVRRRVLTGPAVLVDVAGVVGGVEPGVRSLFGAAARGGGRSRVVELWAQRGDIERLQCCHRLVEVS